ncbi:MAG: hypothetical protein KAT07_13700, partial [Calditrichia bacterium]|nr:hypothetical protein [Calditrichia bacterium]
MKNHRLIQLILLSKLLFVIPLFAQDIRFEHISVENGLSNNHVLCILQDSIGILWVGTINGLNKYDGYNFTVYRHDPGDPKSLSNNYVKTIFEDKSGILWVGTYGGGLNRFNRETDQFTHYQHDSDDLNSLSNRNVRTIFEDNSGILWIGTQGGGVNKFDREIEQFTRYLHDPNNPHSLSNNKVHSIYEDQMGVLWIGTENGGLNKLDKDRKQFVRYLHDPSNPHSLSNNLVSSIYEDKSKVLWIGTIGGGLNKNNRAKDKFIHYRHIPDNPNSLSHNIVKTIIEDKSGVLWIGTYGGGVNRFNRETEQFTNYQHDPHNLNSLSNNYVVSMSLDSLDVLWAGTDGGGLNRFDCETEQFTNYKHDPNNPNSLSDNYVSEVFLDRSGMIWVGTYKGNLNKFDYNKEKYTHFQHDSTVHELLLINMVNRVYEDRAGILWVGTFNGLKQIDPNTGQFIHYWHNLDDPKSLSNDRVISIYEDNSSVLWIGTAGGLDKFDREKEQFTHYSEKDGLQNDVIRSIMEDKHGNLWLSTDKGLSKFNPNTKKFRNYDENDGLQNTQFSEANHRGKNGEMFFGGSNGIDMFYPDSIKDNQHIPSVVVTDFQLFNESVEITPDDIAERKHGFFLPKHISAIDEIELSYKESVFSFEFAALDYRSPQKNQYAYKMEGFDQNWYYTDSKKRFVTYTNLDPGQYMFHVKGSNNDGVWNEVGTSIKIIITPPWWRTNWAYVMYVLLIGISLYGIWRFQLNRLKLNQKLEMEHFEAQRLKDMDEMKSRFFANISHEFRTPLMLILGPLESMVSRIRSEKMKQELQMMRRNGRQLLRLISQLLDLSKIETDSMILETRPENIIPLLKGITNSFVSLAERKQISLQFQATDETVSVYIDRSKVETIASNLLSNAFKFTEKNGRIEVTISTADGFLEISILDTGIGIAPDRIDKIFDRFYQVDDTHTREIEGTGIGLALTKELVKLHRGTISVTSLPGKGSTFAVKLPLGSDHLKESEILEEPVEEEVIERSVLEAETGVGLIPEQSEKTKKDRQGKFAPLVLIVEDNADVRSYIR